MKKKTVLLATLLSICFLSSLAFFLMLNQKTTQEKQDHLFYVSSGSMEPTLNIGDSIVVQGISDFSELYVGLYKFPNGTLNHNPGEIIVYYDPRYGKDPNHPIIHRTVEKKQLEDGTWYFYTKGDASSGSSYDPWSPIGQDYIIGKVVDVNPFLTVTHLDFGLTLTKIIAIMSGVLSIVVIVLDKIGSAILFLLNRQER